MKSNIKNFALLCFVFLSISLALSHADPAYAKYSSIVIDAGTGKIFSAENADVKRHPASLTKIMTLYMIFDALEKGKVTLATKMKVSRYAARMPRSKLWLKSGSSITVKNAILALVTRSANDAAVVVAEHLGGTEKAFAKDMTSRARAIGMRRTTFMNASGLRNKKQLSTARDMALLGQRIQQDFPAYYKYFSVKKFKYQGQTHSNHNQLLGDYQGTDGIKTGYISASGFNLVASVQRGDRRLIGVVFGGRSGRSRDEQMIRLLDRAYRGIEIVEIRPPDRFAEKKMPATIAGLDSTDNPFSQLVPARAGEDRMSPAIDDMQATGDDIETTGDDMQATGDDIETSGDDIETSGDDMQEAGNSAGWAIQVGAFRYKAKADQVAYDTILKLGNLAKRTRVIVSPVNSRGGRLFRARLIGFDENSARKSCKFLQSDGNPCVPVAPGAKDQVASNNR